MQALPPVLGRVLTPAPPLPQPEPPVAVG